MVKYQDRYWIETNAEWTTVQQPDITQNAKFNKTDIIATSFEVYPLELRANPFLPPTFQQRPDFNFVQEHFRAQPLHSPNSCLWSATSPQSASSNTTPQRSNQTSSPNTSVSLPHVELTNSLQPPKNTALSPSSFIPEIR